MSSILEAASGKQFHLCEKCGLQCCSSGRGPVLRCSHPLELQVLVELLHSQLLTIRLDIEGCEKSLSTLDDISHSGNEEMRELTLGYAEQVICT